MSQVYPDVTGGAELFGYRLCEGLSAKGHSVALFPLTASESATNSYTRMGVRVVTRFPWFLRTRHGLVRLFITVPLAFVRGARDKSHAVLCFSTSSLLLGYPVARFLNKRCIVRFMGIDIYYLDHKPRNASEWLAKLSYRLGLEFSRKSDAVIVMSTWMKERLVQGGVPEKIVKIIPNGFDIGTVRHAATGPRSPNLVFVGRLIEDLRGRKQISLLVRTFAKFADMHPGVTLTLVGDGPERQRIARLIETLGMGNTIRMTGRVEPKEVFRYLSEADIFVFPSAIEGMSNSLMEAVLTGLPVVASDIPANRELLGSSGSVLFFPVGSPEALLFALQQMVADLPHKTELARQVASEFSLRYSMDAAVRAYESVLFPLDLESGVHLESQC